MKKIGTPKPDKFLLVDVDEIERWKVRCEVLDDELNVEKFTNPIEPCLGRPLASAGRVRGASKHAKFVGVFRQRQAGPNYFLPAVPVGRMTSEPILRANGVAENHACGPRYLAVGWNRVIANDPDNTIGELTEKPVAQKLRFDRAEVMRNLARCRAILVSVLARNRSIRMRRAANSSYAKSANRSAKFAETTTTRLVGAVTREFTATNWGVA